MKNKENTVELSKRLQAVADLVTPGMRLADVGTDHGYIPIYLVEQEIVPEAIAMDINEGPLLRAKEHIEEKHLESKIKTRLSDGLSALKIGEADAMITAGMGGGLVIHILSAEEEKAKSLKELILQPQSELAKVRAYLLEEGYETIAEDMVFEDGKYYPMMKVRYAGRKLTEEANYSIAELTYGRGLMKNAHPVLKDFLHYEIGVNEKILRSLEKQSGERIEKRKEEIKEELERIREVLDMYF